MRFYIIRKMFFLFVIFLCCVFVSGENTTTTSINNDTSTIIPKFATPCTTPNGEEALCMEINRCPLFPPEGLPESHESYGFFQKSNCGPKRAKIMRVCCGRFAKYVNEQDIGILPSDCGKQNPVLASRIFGGKEASLGEFPWLAKLVHVNRYGIKNYGCSAVLIHKKFVLTAAHCVSPKILGPLGPVREVILGDHDLKSSIDCVGVGKAKMCAPEPVIAIAGTPHVHSHYNQSSEDHINDIAIIQLREEVTFTDFIRPICISEISSEHTTMWLSGWGKTERDESSDVKLNVDVPKIPFESCYDKYNAISVNLKRKNQICAGGVAGKDSCSGDSGGPLMVSDGPTWYLEGIVSFGVGCGKHGWPGVYTNVPKYSKWIKAQVVRKLENLRRKRNRKY